MESGKKSKKPNGKRRQRRKKSLQIRSVEAALWMFDLPLGERVNNEHCYCWGF